MKLGILTFHSQLNYGGVLQCWALQKALMRLLREELRVKSEECEVVVVDRWLDEKNWRLRREFVELGLKGWIKLVIRGLLGCGDFGKLMRTIRTIRFVRSLGLSKEHFCAWPEIKHSNIRTFEHLDVLIVGSDQVWHCGDWGNPRPYLLEGAPNIRAISYAASFGLKSLPPDMIDLYKHGLGRFAALSCREKEGVKICRDLGYEATHVVDPTLLLEPSDWCKLTGNRTIEQSNNQKLVCYFISTDLPTVLPSLESFAEKMDCTVEVITNNQPMLKPMPRSIGAVVRNFRQGRVKICRGYGPKEFVKAFAGATWAFTDSFHAVMFSSIFNCNARFLVPQEGWRRPMFSRISEFAEKCIKGNFLVDDVAQALLSFERGETIVYDVGRIAEMRAGSMAWLKNAII